MEKPVSFKNQAHQALFGILHIPENGNKYDKRIGVNFLNPGLKNRVAPNRLNVKIARMLCEKGFYVFRCDPSGIGDSDGQLSKNNEKVFDLWSMIQKGAFIHDTIHSNSFFIEKANLDSLVLIGQCGAGVTALLCGEIDKRIDGLILIDTPFRIVPSTIDMSSITTEYNKPDELIKRSLQYILNPEKLKKLMTLNINWRLYLNAIGTLIQDLFRGKRVSEIQNISDRFNWQMSRAFQAFMGRKGKTCFIFAENDFTLKEFMQDFRPNFLDVNDRYTKHYTFNIIKNANHIYTEISWQHELMNTILHWITNIQKD